MTETIIYKLTVTTSVANLEYDKQLADYYEAQKRREWDRGTFMELQHPSRMVEQRTMEVLLNEPEYRAFKQAVIEQFK
jgi:hypothetical protein